MDEATHCRRPEIIDTKIVMHTVQGGEMGGATTCMKPPR